MQSRGEKLDWMHELLGSSKEFLVWMMETNFKKLGNWYLKSKMALAMVEDTSSRHDQLTSMSIKGIIIGSPPLSCSTRKIWIYMNLQWEVHNLFRLLTCHSECNISMHALFPPSPVHVTHACMANFPLLVCFPYFGENL